MGDPAVDTGVLTAQPDGAGASGPPGPVLLVTKLHPPPLRAGHVARPGLVERLRAASATRASLVRAPAGGGKSSLLAEWRRAEEGRRPFAWLSLDADDNDPVRFWTYVVESLRTAGVAVPADVLPSLAAPGARPVDAALPRLLNALAASPDEVVLVLDDLHVVAREDVLAQLAFLLERLPPTAHVALASRSEPPPPFPGPRLRARGHLVDVAAADLRFGVDEAEELLNGGLALGLGADEVRQLQRRTEGWAAGLVLAALSLRGGGTGVRSIAAISGDDRHLADFLTAEMLADEPPEVRDFLVRTSILARMCAPLCDHVLGRADSAEVLERIEGSNLLVVGLDNRRLWFRYHHLLGELLRTRLQHEVDEEDRRALHRRAAAWWEGHGETPEAIGHARAAGDGEHAAALVEAAWNRYLQHGQLATVQGWLDALPATAGGPAVALARGWTAQNRGDLAAAAAHAEEAARAGAQARWRGTVTVSAGTAMLRATLHYMRGALGDATREAREALRTGARGSAWVANADATLGSSLLWLGTDTEEADAVLEEAIGAAEPDENTISTLRALGARALLRLELGDGDAAGGLAARARDLRDRQGLGEYGWAAVVSLAEGRLAEDHGDLDGARRAHLRAAHLAGRGHITPEGAYAEIRLALLCATARRPDEARAHLRRARLALAAATDAGMLHHELLAAERAAGPARAGTPAAGEEDLTERELGVLRMLASSLSQPEIASALYVTANTLKTHTRAIYRKLGASSRSDAVARARERGLL